MAVPDAAKRAYKSALTTLYADIVGECEKRALDAFSHGFDERAEAMRDLRDHFRHAAAQQEIHL